MAIVAPTPITALSDPPDTADPENFDARADTFFQEIHDNLQPEANALATNVYNNALEAESAGNTSVAYATKTDGYAAASDNSAKSWAVGGTGAGNPAAGSAKDWATKTGGAVAGGELSAKQHALNAGDSEDAAAASAASALNAPGTSATSTTSLSIGVGSKSLTLAQTGKAFSVGQTVVLARTSDPATRMTGPITAFTSGTGAMTVSVEATNGSGGPYTDWTVSLSAPMAATVASQAEAEAGTANDREMTPLRTAQAISALGRFAPDVIINHETASGGSGGSYSGGAWRTQLLNTAVRNVGSVASLASNQVTLPSGTWLLRGRATYSQNNTPSAPARLRLYNATDAAVIAQGLNGIAVYSTTDSAIGSVTLDVVAIVTLAGSKAIELQVRPNAGGGVVNGASTVSSGDPEVYATLEATRLS